MSPTLIFWLIRIGIVAIGIASMAAVYFGWEHHERDIGREEVRAEWKAQVEQENLRNAKERARQLEHQQEAVNAFIVQTQAAQADAAAARAAGDSLRGQLARYVAAGRAAAGNPGAAGGRAPADDPIGVLADVLGRADQRAGVLAEFADRSRAAGILCERSYDSLAPVKR